VEVLYPTKDDWKSFTMDLGEQSAIITSTTLMRALYATVLDMGWYYSLLENYHSSEPKLCMDRWI